MVKQTKKKLDKRTGGFGYFHILLDPFASMKDIEGVIQKEKWKKV